MPFQTLPSRTPRLCSKSMLAGSLLGLIWKVPAERGLPSGLSLRKRSPLKGEPMSELVGAFALALRPAGGPDPLKVGRPCFAWDRAGEREHVHHRSVRRLAVSSIAAPVLEDHIRPATRAPRVCGG